MNMNEIPKQLPEDYFAIDDVCAVHISTIERFTEDITAFLDYLDIAIEYPTMEDPDVLKEITIRSSATTLDVARRMQEHGTLMQAVAQFLKGGFWFDVQHQPLFLASNNP